MIKTSLTGPKVDHEKVRRAVERASVEPVRKCGLLVEADAKRSMKAGGAHGRVGPRGGYVREPSDPDTPPHVQRGALRASIQTATTRRRTAVVGPTELYGKVHEFGTRTHPQRAFMLPALKRMQPKFPTKFRRLKLGR